MSHPSHNWQEMTDNCCVPQCYANRNGPGADLPCPSPWAWPPDKGDVMTDVKPITPKQAKVQRVNTIPAQVLEAFNELITENLDGRSSTVSQKDVLARIRSKLNATLGNDFTNQEICNRGWLNIEDVYSASGWKVTYDKPGYDENYDATFEFTAKK